MWGWNGMDVGMGWDTWRLVIVSLEMFSHSPISGLITFGMNEFKGHGFHIVGLLELDWIFEGDINERESLVVLEEWRR
jgi:hypothetical protein